MTTFYMLHAVFQIAIKSASCIQRISQAGAIIKYRRPNKSDDRSKRERGAARGLLVQCRIIYNHSRLLQIRDTN